MNGMPSRIPSRQNLRTVGCCCRALPHGWTNTFASLRLFLVPNTTIGGFHLAGLGTHETESRPCCLGKARERLVTHTLHYRSGVCVCGVHGRSSERAQKSLKAVVWVIIRGSPIVRLGHRSPSGPK